MYLWSDAVEIADVSDVNLKTGLLARTIAELDDW
jgi:hypothetical protein